MRDLRYSMKGYANVTKSKICLLVIIASLPLFSQSNFRFGAELEGWATEAGIEGTNSNYKHKEVFPSVGLIGQYGPFSLKLTATSKERFKGDATFNWETLSHARNTVQIERVTALFDTTADRQDMDLTAGYSWPIGLVTFGGYKKLKFTQTFTNTSYIARTDVYMGGQYQGSTEPIKYPVYWIYSSKLDYDGYFLGLSYGYQPGDGAVSFDISTAYTTLKGEPSVINIVRNGTNQSTDEERYEDVDARGLSWRLSVSYQLFPSGTAYGGFKVQNYNLIKDTQDGPSMKSDGLVLGIKYMF